MLQDKLASQARGAGAGLLVPWQRGGEEAGKEATWAWLAAAAGGLGLFLLRELFSLALQRSALRSCSQPGSPGSGTDESSSLAWQPAAKAPAK